MIARRWVVAGLVQGVGFRWFLRERAAALGVTGWARNLADGSVEVVAAAPPEAIEAFGASILSGPAGSRVTTVTTENVPHESVDTKSFIIKR